MHAFRSRLLGRRHAAWLLWLALLLPLAQACAAWHALSHARAELAGDPADGKALHPASHCDLCLVAAAVSGGAPPGVAPAVHVDATAHPAPSALQESVRASAPARAYLSRAPPPATH
jgi:hypothetical protein